MRSQVPRRPIAKLRICNPLSNNRSSNRRRGRGGNRSQGGNQGNRIDSRARGNAPQLLEKYKKLAHDAAMNGDRVQSEYYLQFADHYFRVLADSRAQREEQRPRRDSDRDGPRDHDDSEDEYERSDRGERSQRHTRDDRNEPEEGERGAEGAEAAEGSAEENPFTRKPRANERGGQRGKPRGRGKGDDNGADEEDSDSGGFDASVLPPAIGKDEGEEKPRRTRRPKSRDDGEGDDGTLEAVG
jgi:hypothetical protein